MEKPTGIGVTGRRTEVCRFRRSLYGLKQAFRIWNEKFDSFHVKYCFSKNVSDPCMYFQEDDRQNITFVTIRVNYCLPCNIPMSKLKDSRICSRNFKITSGSALSNRIENLLSSYKGCTQEVQLKSLAGKILNIFIYLLIHFRV